MTLGEQGRQRIADLLVGDDRAEDGDRAFMIKTLEALEEQNLILNEGELALVHLDLGLFKYAKNQGMDDHRARSFTKLTENVLWGGLDRDRDLLSFSGERGRVDILSPDFTATVLASGDRAQLITLLSMRSNRYANGIKRFGEKEFSAIKQVLGEYKANGFDVAKTVDQWLGEIG